MSNFAAHNLAAACLSGAWTERAMLHRAQQALGSKPPWLRPLIREVLAASPQPPTQEQVSRVIQANRAFVRVGQSIPVHKLFVLRPVMAVRPSWDVPALATAGALAEFLGVSVGQLEALADCQYREGRRPPGRLANYVYRWFAGKSRKLRLLEMPKRRLKALQRRVLAEILERIPCHEAVHSYRRGRSPLSYAAPHVGQAIVLRFDLRDFFPSIQRRRVHAIFRTAGYPREVARLLTGLCTNSVPHAVLDERDLEHTIRQSFRSPHLPQGAPTSPALANLCAYRLDRRLMGLARKVGATYTRYADDLAFSGDDRLARCARRFQVHVARLALEEGWELHTRKSRFMRQGVRQQLAGIVVNAHPNFRRLDYDRLKAILHNCIHGGPASQNHEARSDFRAYLAGKVAYVSLLNPRRGDKLKNLLNQIRWDSAACST